MINIADIHAHILPGVDDGARDWEESLAMARAARSQGIQTIIATPHHSRTKGAYGIRELAAELQERVRREMPELSIYPGEELLYYEGLGDDLKSGNVLTLGGTRYVLVEFEPLASYSRMYQAVRKLNQLRYTPVLAHVERYPSMRESGRMEELNALDCLMQMNYKSLEGSPLDRQARWCRNQVRSGDIHFLGTDMHRMDFRRPDILRACRWLERHVPGELARAVTSANALEMLKKT